MKVPDFSTSNNDIPLTSVSDEDSLRVEKSHFDHELCTYTYYFFQRRL
jgi:hypothetical protein